MRERWLRNPRWGLVQITTWLFLAGVLGGCVTATFVPTVGTAYPARPVDCELEIFSSAIPDREYEEIGIVEAEGSAWNSDLEDVLPAMREEACLAGGDGIILQRGDTFTEGDDGMRVQRIIATVFRWSQSK